MSTFITRFDPTGSGPLLAVKDVIDVAGVPTTAGCRAVAEEAAPALADAACLAGARAAGARIVGKTNLHELALGVSGENPWYGTPVNPLDPGRVPGGSSSGSAVAVATGEADIAYGSDTGGSVRIPSACCGTAGLKTTHGRVPLQGVWPLAPSFDTVGPMARDVDGLVAGMALLEPGFAPSSPASWRVGRLRPKADPVIDAAVDEALRLAEFEVVELEVPEWPEITALAGLLLVVEAWAVDGPLVQRAESSIGADVVARLRIGQAADDAGVQRARDAGRRWRQELSDLLRRVDMLATPTLTIFPPMLGHGDDLLLARCTLPANLAGIPALSLPVPSTAGFPASLQLMGPHHGEELLLAAGAAVEGATASLRLR